MSDNMQAQITKYNVTNKRVFLRADLNVPLHDGNIIDDFKLRKILPTIDFLRAQGACIILATHIDRPLYCQAELSTQNLVSWFMNKKYPVNFQADLEQARIESHKRAPGSILLLENLRFFSGEQSTDQIGRTEFAQALYQLADFYINDAFADIHRADCSVYNLPLLFDKNHKTMGFLMEHELNILEKVKNTQRRPRVLILGGGKVTDKLPLVKDLLNFFDILLIGPALAFTFMAAEKQQTGASFVAHNIIKLAETILIKARNQHVALIIPTDFIVDDISTHDQTEQLYIIEAAHLTENMRGITIGPQTLATWKIEIEHAGIIIVNGTMGFEDKPETLESYKLLLQAVAQSSSLSIIGGGESVAAVYSQGLESTIDFCSTGGGAMLYVLAGKPLPALEALQQA
jgi:phosphoglycerate kinase